MGALPLRLTTDDRSYTGACALRMIVLLNPVTWFVFTALMAVTGYRQTMDLAIYRRILVSIALVLLMPPLAWFTDRLSGGSGTSERSATSNGRLRRVA
jgi:hypothetical protein